VVISTSSRNIIMAGSIYTITNGIVGLPNGYTNLSVPQGSIITPPTIGPDTPLTTPLGVTIAVEQLARASNYTASNQAFNLSATGLKPNTIHTFTFNGTDVSSMCQPTGWDLGGQLITNANGAISFTYFYNSGISTGTNVTATQSLINNLIGNKIGLLSSADGTSTAQVTITIAQPTPQTIPLIINSYWYTTWGLDL